MNRYHIPNLARACKVLKLFAGSDESLSSSEVARRLDIPRTTALRILLTLGEEGLISREGADYRAGGELVRLGLKALSAVPLRARALPVLRQLAERTGETSHLAILSGDRALILEVIDSPNPVRAVSRPGTMAALHCSATGKVLLAFGVPIERRQAFLQSLDLEARTPNTITDRAILDAACGDIVRRGYAVDDEEYHLGVRCLAAPIADSEGRVVAAVGITASTMSFTKKRVLEVAGHVVLAAESLSDAGAGVKPQAARGVA